MSLSSEGYSDDWNIFFNIRVITVHDANVDCNTLFCWKWLSEEICWITIVIEFGENQDTWWITITEPINKWIDYSSLVVIKRTKNLCRKLRYHKINYLVYQLGSKIYPTSIALVLSAPMLFSNPRIPNQRLRSPEYVFALNRI